MNSYLGVRPFHRVSTADTNLATVKTKPGWITNIVAGNVNAAVRYLKLFDKATNPVLGTDVPVMTIPLPGGGAPGSLEPILFPYGLRFDNGIAMALTTGIADSDNTGVAASELVINIAFSDAQS